MIFDEVLYKFENVIALENDSDKLEFMIKLGEALIYCHSKNIMHLDLKPSNVLADKKD